MRAQEFIKGNIEIRHQPTSTGGVEINAFDKNREIGFVRFSPTKSGQYKAAMVHVSPDYRRQGIGSRMYQYARDLGLDIVQSDTQTDLGQAFWSKAHESLDEELTFKGYPCIYDCSGHQAGYEYATRWGLEPDECPYGNSNSFWEGCKSRGEEQEIEENFADGKIKGKSRPGRVKRAGASCAGSVSELRSRAKKYSGERGKMYHWCANMKSGRKK